MQRALTAVALVAAMSVPLLLLAHEGHTHHVMGTVNSVDAKRLEVKDMTDTVVAVQLTAETRYLRGDTPVTVSDIKVGERVMVEATEENGAMIAQVVRLETAAAEKSNE